MIQTPNKTPEYYSVTEVCKMLRMKRNQFEYLCLSGKLDKNNYRIAGKLIFTDADVEDVRAAFESLDNVYS